MHTEKITVAYHEMDKVAEQVAESIAHATRDIDRSNLVILCGESHVQKSHQFFQARLMQHLHARGLVGAFCDEVQTSVPVDHVDNIDMFQDLTKIDFMHAAVVMQAKMLGLPVHYMDMPEHQEEKMCVGGLPEAMRESPCVKRLVQKHYITEHFVQSSEPVYEDEPDGLLRRNVYMAETISRLDRQSDGKAVLACGGRQHMRETGACPITLSRMLLANGKDVVMVNQFKSSLWNNHFRKHEMPTLQPDERNRLHAMFNVNLPKLANGFGHGFGTSENTELVQDKWRQMEEANNLPSILDTSYFKK